MPRLALSLIACACLAAGCQRSVESPAGATPPAPVPQVAPSPQAAPATPAAAPQPQRQPSGHARYKALGTEPFWAVEVDGARLRYTTPDDQAGSTLEVARDEVAGFPRFSGQWQGQPLVLTLSAGPCSDGMSDNVHALSARLSVRGEELRGCANPQP